MWCSVALWKILGDGIAHGPQETTIAGGRRVSGNKNSDSDSDRKRTFFTISVRLSNMNIL